ncbi:hypothetical protein RB614_40485 [Phytohabitans sp. ZYX-F-186]|uniref:Uncharacterized protein n=1 Tax=Phytohabitans maris TaxID=3071409 RepID=A0ABU0ZUR5_9ACTN|nr:hypothetical protein [Phytohabitans sp. ZYX-F-186]MDQ7910788.1 hypothetical protein [Phytohabitans sp. ZYX-F-186]
MVRRRVAVEFTAEMRAFLRRMRDGERATGDLNQSTQDAREEVRKFGQESDKAARQVADSARRSAHEWRSAAGRMRSARRDFEAAGAEAGRATGDKFVSESQRTMRDARGRLVAAGHAAGRAIGDGLDRAVLARLRDVRARLAALRAEGIGPIHTPTIGGGGGDGGGGPIGDAAGAIAELADEVLEVGERARTITAATRAATRQIEAANRIALNRIGQPYYTDSGRYAPHAEARAAGLMGDAADSVRRLRDETQRARTEVAELAAASNQAATEVARSAERAAGYWRDAAGRLRDTRGKFAKAGADAGQALADGFEREAGSRLRAAAGRGFGAGDAVRAALRRAGNIDVSGPLSARSMAILAAGGVAAVAALQGVPPVLAAIGGGLGSIPSLAAGATGSILTLVASLSGVGDSIGEIFDPPAGGGSGGIDRTAAATRQLESAERGLARAQRDSRLAQHEVNRARQQATREIRDMGIALGRVALDERDAALSVREAAEELARLQRDRALDPTGVSELELERAQLAYDQAIQSQIEVAARAQDAREDQAAAARAGVEGSEQVQAALRRQADAADQVLDATNAVIDAQEALAQAGAGAGGGGAATAYSKLSREGKQFVDSIRAQKDAIFDLKNLGQDTILDGLDREFTQTFEHTLPFARKQVVRFGDTWNDTFKALFRLGRDDEFLAGLDVAFGATDRFFDKVNTRIPTTGRAFAKLFTGSEVFVDRFGDSLLSYVDDFNEWIDEASSSGRLEEIFEGAAEQADALLDIGKEIIRLVARISGQGIDSPLLRDAADGLKRFNDEARRAEDLDGIIATGNAAIRGLVDVLLILGDTASDVLADPATRDAVEIFFDVLTLGAGVVHDLVGLFQLLPGPIQSTVLAGAALALVGGRLFRVFERVEGVAGRVNNRIGQMGPLGAQAAVGLERAGRGARVAGAALLTAQVASAALGEDLRAQVGPLSRNLEEFARGGQVGGEAARLFGDDLGKLDQALKDIADTGAWSSFVRGTTGMVESLTGLGNAYDLSLLHSRERLEALDAALAQMVNSGNATGAQAAFNKLAASAAEQGISVRELNSVLPTYANAIEEAGGANAIAAEQIDAFAEAQRTAQDATTDWLDAELGVEEALARASDTISENGEAWNLNTEEGRENRRALMDAASAANDAVTAKLRETGSVEQANVVYRENYNRIYNLARQAGATKDEAKKLADQLLKTPDVNVAFETPGLATAVRLAEEYNEMLNRIRRNVKAGGFGVNGNYLGIGGNRWGGVYEHAQVGLLREARIYSAVNPARYAFAEPGTGGEAFIPRNGDRERSVSIGRHAMNWYGFDVVPKPAVTATGGTRPASVNYGQLASYVRGTSAAAPAIDYDQLGAAVARHQRGDLAAVASAVGSSETVVQVDGVELARAARAGQRDLDRRA